MIYFSASKLAFYNDEIRDAYYDRYDAWPGDAVLLTDDEMSEYCGVTSPNGKALSAKNGRPVWADAPAPTPEEVIGVTERQRSMLRAMAESEIEWRQDAVDADIATEEEAATLVEWKKYRVLLMRVDTAAPVWPTPPVQ